MRDFKPDEHDQIHTYTLTHEDATEPLELHFETYARSPQDACVTSFLYMSLKMSHAGFTPPWMTQE